MTEPACLEHKANPGFDRVARQIHDLVPVGLIGLASQSFHADSMVDALDALGVRLVDLEPEGCQEHRGAVAAEARGRIRAGRQVTTELLGAVRHIRKAAIEEHRADMRARHPVRPEFPGQYELDEQLGVGGGSALPT